MRGVPQTPTLRIPLKLQPKPQVLGFFDMIASFKINSCLRPYLGEITGSRLISKVKHRRAWVVLGWVTTWEVRVL